MNTLPLISVIITTYKKAEFLHRAIDSVLNQNYKNIEVIVVDDNDSETIYRKNTEQLMEKYKDDKRIKYIKHEQNKNGAAARNTGINNASGEYISFLDDDDVYLYNRISKLVKEMEKPNNKMFGGAYSNIELKMKKKSELLSNNTVCKSGNFKKELLLLNFSIGSGSNMFFRADIIRKLNGFDVRFKRHQDLEFMIRFFTISNLLYIDEILAIKYMDIDIVRFNSKTIEDAKRILIDKFKSDIEEYDRKTQDNILYAHDRELILLYISDLRMRKALFLIKNNIGNISIGEYYKMLMLYIKTLTKKIIFLYSKRKKYE